MLDHASAAVTAEAVCVAGVLWYACVYVCRAVTSKHRLVLASEQKYTLLTPCQQQLRLAHIALPV